MREGGINTLWEKYQMSMNRISFFFFDDDDISFFASFISMYRTYRFFPKTKINSIFLLFYLQTMNTIYRQLITSIVYDK